ncbi:hypothetical protein [Nannocystis sp. SCPEA4]|uniref:Cas10/Cmr2 second palm domain-containing protein n=1 Tax=Nannocystis sp. SCPEA4 TaxID=2996787 RepID=UPI00226D58F2|nr:hypothetical protein [Nannocystis sp. SCPEA4]
MTGVFYILGDADRVREQIERQLLTGHLEELARLSAVLTRELAALVASVEELGAKTIMAGGDDVLFQVPTSAYSFEALRTIAATFLSNTGCTISFGVGPEVELAYLNLRRAKAAGGGIIVATGASS